MRKKSLIALFIALLCLSAAVSCGKSEPAASRDPVTETVEVQRTPLAAPAWFITDGITLRWNAVDNAVGYEVEYFCAEDDDPVVKMIETTLTEAVPVYDKPSQYAARVRALAAEESFYGRSAWTDWLDYFTAETFALQQPQSVEVEDKTVTWTAVEEAVGYKVRVNGETAYTETASYLLPKPVPGTEYAISVQAVGDGYYEDSQWSEEVSFLYTVTYSKPSGLIVTDDGFAKWNAQDDIYDGYTVGVKRSGDSAYTEYRVQSNVFDVTTLADGDYSLKVKVYGGGEYDSEYSDEAVFRISSAARWTASDIVSGFASWNYCTAALSGTGADMYASFRCGEGWGGMLSPVIEVNYGRNPVFAVDYGAVPYGYMGNYYIDGTLYTYAPDAHGGFENETRHFIMTQYSGGKLEAAQGVKSNVQISVGFTLAPAGSSDREVMGVRGARVVYVEDIPEVPDAPEVLDAPSGLRFGGYGISWNAVAGNSAYTPVYRVEIFRLGADGYYSVGVIDDCAATGVDLRDVQGFTDGTYRFSVKALGDGVFYSDSVQTAQSDAAVISSYKIDLADFASDAVNGGHPSTPRAAFSDGKLVLTQSGGYGMLRYVVPQTIDVPHSYMVIEIDSVVGGNYYIRLPLASAGGADDTNTIASNDSAVTGTFTRKLTDIAALSSVSGEQSLALHFGLSGNSMTCVISEISFVTVTAL